MENIIIHELLKDLWIGSNERCEECSHTIPINTEKERQDKTLALKKLLWQVAETPFRSNYYMDQEVIQIPIKELEEMILSEGSFSDVPATYAGGLTAIKRLAYMASQYHWKTKKYWDNNLKSKFLNAVSHYCKSEADREDKGNSRFHSSIFAFPTCAINIFFALLPDMMDCENGVNAHIEVKEAYDQILRIALQVWLLPFRNDHTDRHPISPERFRNHVWWVGANAICYRPLLQSTLLFRCPEMMDTLVYVCTHMLTPTSHNTCDTSFWSEGICADGFGWGHGRQNYSSGYPTQGIITGVGILTYLKGTPWEKELMSLDYSWVIQYMRGITWGEFKRWVAPMQSRHIFMRDSSLLDAQKKDLDQYAVELAHYLSTYLLTPSPNEFQQLVNSKVTPILGYENGTYEGIRYFWNNDDLIKKTESLYFYVNMASSRCHGVECACSMADTMNFFIADGSYVLMKDGDEYKDMMGTWQVSMLPGVTARELYNKELLPEVNWSGYNSKHNYAGGAIQADWGVAGFIHEKDDTRIPDGAGVVNNDFTKEMFGVLAFKGYFILEDTIVCLGAGITDLNPEFGKEIRTTINNTLWKSPVTLYNASGEIIQNISGKQLITLDQNNFYIKQNGILYGIEQCYNKEIRIEAEDRTTHWLELNVTNRDIKDENYPVFELSLSHGKAPIDETYAYSMYTGDRNPKDYIEDITFHIIENSSKLQSIENKDGSVVLAVFYSSDVCCIGSKYEIKVAEECVLLVRASKDKVEITASDPKQNPKLKDITIWIRKTDHSQWMPYEVSLPEGSNVGKPTTKTFVNAT